MNAGPHTNSNDMNLVEKIAYYAALVMLHGQKEADTFLLNEVPAEWHDAIRACVNSNGVLVNHRGTEFFMEQYQGVGILPEPRTEQPW